ncbi:MAG TPA: membrane dipeptidase [Terriglobales bacterium]|nr:membrane dipeptidase [Terriglobales bacterium]
MNRRQWLKTAGAAAAMSVGAPFLNRGRFRLFAFSTREYSARCRELVARSLVIDMLSQFKLGAYPDVLGGPDHSTVTWFSRPETFTAEDFARYRESGISVFHIGWGTRRGDPFDDAQKVFHAWNRFILAHAGEFLRITDPGLLAEVKRAGKVGILLGLQGADHFRTVEDIPLFFDLGQRVSQLTYNLPNRLGCGYESRPDTGLTAFGAEVVARMNQEGMAIDLSHCGDRTTLDALAASRRPVLFTHADCRALNPHPRNKSDEEIRKLAAGGGVIGITGVRMFVKAAEPVTLDDVLDHVDHVARLVGVEYVGMGSDIDLDGYDALPPALRAKMLTGYKSSPAFHGRGDIDGLNHPQRVFDLTEGLLRRGYSDSDIAGILGANFQRALDQIWR